MTTTRVTRLTSCNYEARQPVRQGKVMQLAARPCSLLPSPCCLLPAPTPSSHFPAPPQCAHRENPEPGPEDADWQATQAHYKTWVPGTTLQLESAQLCVQAPMVRSLQKQETPIPAPIIHRGWWGGGHGSRWQFYLRQAVVGLFRKWRTLCGLV